MPFDPNLPANHAPVVSAELRSQFNGLKALIDGLQAQVNALQSALPTPALDHDEDNDADRLWLSKALQPAQPDEWLGWKSASGLGTPDTNPSEWDGPLGFDDDNSDDANWIIEWDGFSSNGHFIAAYRVGQTRSPFSNKVSAS